MQKDHTSLICDVSELSGLFSSSESLSVFLDKAVNLIALHMKAQVCSIYLFDEQTRELTLEATKGLSKDSIGKVKLSFGEGLTGQAVKEMRSICVKHASKAKGYKYFPGSNEELYESFLAVPIMRGQRRIGAVVVQNAQINYFTADDINVFRAITAQIANTIEMAKLLMDLDSNKKIEARKIFDKNIKFIKGKSASEGVCYSSAKVFGWNLDWLDSKTISSNNYSLDDFKNAVINTEKRLEELQIEIEDRLSDEASLIFGAQVLMLKDQSFIHDVEENFKVSTDLIDAIKKTIKKYCLMFDALSNEYLREKKYDIQDLGKTLINVLMGNVDNKGEFQDCIVIAHDLYPTDILKLSLQNVKGIVLLSGGITSHLSILARSLQIPLVICSMQELLEVESGTKLLLDARQGNIYVNPDNQVLDPFKDKLNSLARVDENFNDVRSETFTQDGRKITLLANINLLNDSKIAIASKAEGVGLYRTEFPFMIRSDFPTEEEQFNIYKKLTDSFKGKEVTFRTLDVGGDKVLSYYDDVKENNPFLGMRSIRFSLKHKDIFKNQIRAILRAGSESNLKIMFPMICSVEEIIEAKNMLKQCADELRQQNMAFNKNPKVGAMIELPSIIEILDDVCKHVDFFSIGTNDFIQYMLAVDRTNEQVSDLYLPHHPAILRSIKRVVDIVAENKKELSVCGDMAHSLSYVKILLFFGIDRLSVNPSLIPNIQKYVEKLSLKNSDKFVSELLNLKLSADVANLLKN